MNQSPKTEDPEAQEHLQHALEEHLDDHPPSLIKEFLYFLTENKKWWLVPLIVIFLLLGLLAFLGSSPLAPVIYPIF